MLGRLHFIWFCHQPFFIPDEEVAWRVDATYVPLIDAFVERDLPFSLGLTGGLLERIAGLRPEFIAWLRTLLEEEKLSLIGSAYQHPLLPDLESRWAEAHLDEDLRVRRELALPSRAVLWPTELAWAMPVGSLAAGRGYDAVVVDGSCRDAADTAPTWAQAEGRLRRRRLAPQRGARPSRLTLRLEEGRSIELLVRERELSNALLDAVRGEERDERVQLQDFLGALRRVQANAASPQGPLLIGEDAERLLPDGLPALLDLLDGLQREGVDFCGLARFRAEAAARPIDYVPAGTMEEDLDLWEGNLDDRWFRAQLHRSAAEMTACLDPAAPRDAVERHWRDRMLALQDSGFYFWPYVSRSRRPFFDGLQEVDAWLRTRGRQ